MKQSEVATLLGLCAAYDSRTIGDADVSAWHQLMAHVPLEDAQSAVLEHYSREARRAMPADILNGVKRIRRDRVEGADASFVMIGNPDDTDEYRRQLIAHHTAVADGTASNRHVKTHPIAVISS